MTAQISNFLASLTTDMARPARFNVMIPIPIKLIAWRNIARTLSFRCENADLPSITLATTERKIYGPTEQQPYLRTYNTSSMTFMVTESMEEKKFFDAWVELINPSSTYDTNYKSDYITPITVNQYNVNDQIVYSVTLVDAFPVSVNQLDLDWSNETSFHKLVVTFAYHTWEQNGIQAVASDVLDAAVSSGVNIATEVLSALASPPKPYFCPSPNPTWSMQSVAGGFVAK